MTGYLAELLPQANRRVPVPNGTITLLLLDYEHQSYFLSNNPDISPPTSGRYANAGRDE